MYFNTYNIIIFEMNILFIGPVFNGYEVAITNTIKKSGKYDDVIFRPECPLHSLGQFGVVKRLIPSLANKLIDNHNRSIKQIIEEHHIDVIYIIRGEFLSIEMLLDIKEKKPHIKIIVYQWDSIHRSPNAQRLFKCSDITYSFDYKDAKDFKLEYLPLFYCWDEIGFESQKNENLYEYDVMSIGSFREHRMPYIFAMKSFCIKNGLNFKFHNYERLGAFLIHRKKQGVKWADVNFKSISYKKYFKILCKTRCVLDVSSPLQEGLTMRTMETLSMGVKLATTNENIKKEPFYNPHNVFILNSPNDIYSDEFKEFLNSKFKNQPGLISLTEWLEKQGVL